MHECYRGRTTIARPLIRNQRCLEKAFRDAQQAMPGSNREIVASSHDGFNSVRATATRDKKLSFLSREASATYTNAAPASIKDRSARFGARIARVIRRGCGFATDPESGRKDRQSGEKKRNASRLPTHRASAGGSKKLRKICYPAHGKGTATLPASSPQGRPGVVLSLTATLADLKAV